MQQSNIIFGVITLAFIIFITLRGELPAYLSLLRGSKSSSSAAGSNASGNSLDSIAASAVNSFENSFATSAGYSAPAPTSYTNSDGSLNPSAAIQYLFGGQ